MERIKTLEEGISEVRKTHLTTWFHEIQTPEELSLIRQAKREHLPVFAELSGEALVNEDHDAFWRAIEEGIIDRISYVPSLSPFLEEAVDQFRLSIENREKLIAASGEL